MVKTFARVARERIRLDSGGYRRDHLRALTQRVEVADKEVRIMGSKSELLRTLVAASGGKPGVAGVQSSVLKWRTYQKANAVPLRPLRSDFHFLAGSLVGRCSDSSSTRAPASAGA